MVFLFSVLFFFWFTFHIFNLYIFIDSKIVVAPQLQLYIPYCSTTYLKYLAPEA